jgi:SAM-dependent methyltransferase
VSRKLEALVAELVGAAALGPGARAVDYGCADAPYRHLLGASVEYVGADLIGNPAATVTLQPDGTLPLPDGSADLVLSTQVLEHVEAPVSYLAEAYRVLRPGGSLVLTTHGIMYLHRDPQDYWRWTSDGLALVVSDAGFRVAEQRGILGLAAAALQLLQAGTAGRVPRFLRRPYVVLMQALIALADRRASESSRVENGLVLGIRAVKPT